MVNTIREILTLSEDEHANICIFDHAGNYRRLQVYQNLIFFTNINTSIKGLLFSKDNLAIFYYTHEDIFDCSICGMMRRSKQNGVTTVNHVFTLNIA